MKNSIDAVDANKLAKECSNFVINNEFHEIMEMIIQTCKQGDFTLNTKSELYPDTIKKLISLGYAVITPPGNTIIDWSFLETNND